MNSSRQVSAPSPSPSPSPSIPVFIQQGCDVLTQVAVRSRSAEQDLILQQFGELTNNNEPSFSPELLRRVKLGVCEEEDIKVIQQLHSSCLTQTFCSPTSTTWDMGSKSIMEQSWTQHIVDNIYSVTSSSCTHVLQPSPMSITPHSNRSKKDETQRECGLDPLLANAILLKYGVIMNKLKKINQLEESSAKLTNDIFVLIKETVDFPVQSRLFSNVLDGVELVMPLKLSQQRNIKHGDLDAAFQFHEEVKTLLSNTSTIDNYKQNEELFWKWIGSCKAPLDNNSQLLRSFEVKSMEVLLRQAFTPMLVKLNGALTDLEGAVIALLLAKKISSEQLSSILCYHNANFTEQFKQFASIVPSLIEPVCGQSTFVLAQLLEVPPRISQESLEADVSELRSKHRLLMQKLADDFCVYSPFKPIFKSS